MGLQQSVASHPCWLNLSYCPLVRSACAEARSLFPNITTNWYYSVTSTPHFPLLGEPLSLDVVNTRVRHRGADVDLLDAPSALAAWLSAESARLPWSAIQRLWTRSLLFQLALTWGFTAALIAFGCAALVAAGVSVPLFRTERPRTDVPAPTPSL